MCRRVAESIRRRKRELKQRKGEEEEVGVLVQTAGGLTFRL